MEKKKFFLQLKERPKRVKTGTVKTIAMPAIMYSGEMWILSEKKINATDM